MSGASRPRQPPPSMTRPVLGAAHEGPPADRPGSPVRWPRPGAFQWKRPADPYQWKRARAGFLWCLALDGYQWCLLAEPYQWK
jgi:hypothetical protein